MFQHADFGQRTGPSVPVHLVLLLQSLCRAGRRTSGGTGTAGTAVLEDGDLHLDDHSQGLKTTAGDHENKHDPNLFYILKVYSFGQKNVN